MMEDRDTRTQGVLDEYDKMRDTYENLSLIHI